MIVFEKVNKAFGSKQVLRDLDLEVRQGEIFVILGRSGTGKSVTLKHLVGLLRCDSGRIVLDGQEIQRLGERHFGPLRRKCGIVFQLPALLDSRTIFENLTLGIRDIPTREKVERTRKALEEVSLGQLWEVMAERYPPQLSYGEQKRLALARTLLTDPDYVLYDEPTTGLDPITARSVHDLIATVSRDLGKTSIVVSHDMRNALRIADRIAVMDKGQVVDLGSPQQIMSSACALTRDFLEDVRNA